MRDIGKRERKITVIDYLTGDKHTFYYRNPLLSERIEYRKKMLTSEGDRIKAIMEARIEGAKNIIIGFEAGTISIDGKVLSCKEGEEGYMPNWPEVLAENCPEILEAIAIKVYESGAEVISENFFTGK